MKITEIKVTNVDYGKVKGYASVVFDGLFKVTGIKIVEGKNGYFVAMASKPDSEGKYRDIYFPVTKEYREELAEQILAKFTGEVTSAPTPKKETAKKETPEPNLDDFDDDEEFPF